ncbi:MAG: hypothetical protein K2G70_03580 [Turicibacter sp.]|nr:hypothetical protein [Turicibacter sp.]
MNSEVSSFIDSISFIDEQEFDQSIEYYQGMIETDLSDVTMSEIEALVRRAEDSCGVHILGFEFSEVLTLEMVETDEASKTCMLNQLNLNQEDIVFKGGGQ